MSISDGRSRAAPRSRARWASVLALAVQSLVLAASACQDDQECIRFSDCAEGLTCAAGRCVTPPKGDSSGPGSTSPDVTVPADAAAQPRVDAAPSATDAATEPGATLDGSDDGATDAASGG